MKKGIIELEPVISPANAALLEASYTSEEVKKAIFSGDKAPGPNGFCAHFFKDVLHIIGHEVTSAILNFFTTGRLLTEIK